MITKNDCLILLAELSKKGINTDEIVNELDEEKHKFTIYVDTLRDKEYNKTYINNNRIREIDRYIRAFCYQTVIFSL